MFQDTVLKKQLTLAHSVDADDAFMFYALSKNLIESKYFSFKHELKDIQTLNNDSCSAKYDVQAISFFAYPDVDDRFQLLSSGGSLGYGYGPVVIGSGDVKENPLDMLKNKDIAIPGEKTTAYLLLKLLVKDFVPHFVEFDEVIDVVRKKKCKFGLVIHEGQLSYQKYNLFKVIDLGEWWLSKTSLPVPLGGNVVRRTLNDFEKKEINEVIKRSISYAMKNKDEVVDYVCKYAREISGDKEKVKTFVSLYVNKFTLDYGLQGKLAIKKLYELALNDGLIKRIPLLDFVE